MINFYSGFIVPDSARQFAVARRELKAKYPGPKEYIGAFDAWYATAAKSCGTLADIDIVDHIGHPVKIAGIDHVGIDSDLDGIKSNPVSLYDVSCFPRLTEELLKRGYAEEDVHKILGGKVLRALRAADQLRRTTAHDMDQLKVDCGQARDQGPPSVRTVRVHQ